MKNVIAKIELNFPDSEKMTITILGRRKTKNLSTEDSESNYEKLEVEVEPKELSKFYSRTHLGNLVNEILESHDFMSYDLPT